MKLEGRRLSLDIRGNDVRLLHQELTQLGFEIPSHEQSETSFGAGTEAAVREFQHQQNLEPTGVVDERTAEAITVAMGNTGDIGRRVEPGPDLTADEELVVKGLVRQSDGQAVSGATVKAFDKRLRSEDLLGQAITDGQGRYEIRYGGESAREAGGALAGLIVRAYGAEGELAASPVVFHPEAEEILDLVVGNAAYRGPSEYERLLTALTPLLEGLSLADLKEDQEHRDITLLSGRSGEDPMRIAVLAAAHRLAKRAGIAPQIFYGLLRNDLPPNLSALLVQDPEVVRRSLELAVADNLIPTRFAEGIDDLLTRFKRLSVTEAVRPVGDGEQQAPLVTLLGTVLTDRGQQATFIERYIDHTGPIERFWDGLREVPELAGQVESLQFGLQVGALTGNHLPLVRELQRMREQGEIVGRSTHRIQTFRDLVYLDEEKWKEIIKRDTDNGKIGVPAGIPGKDDTKVEQYARTLSRIVERSFPTAYVAARLEREDSDERNPLIGLSRDFLTQNVDSFEIDGARLDNYLAEHPKALDDVSKRDRPQLKQRLRAMQRVYRVAPRYEAMMALLDDEKDKIDSAYTIVNMGRNLFALKYGHNPALDNEDNAKRVYARAEQTYAMALAIASDHGMSGTRLPMKALTDERATSDTAIPDWQTLFGSLELCDCEHCRSVYGPAAYLVDLLHFLKGRRIIDPKSLEKKNRDEKTDRILKATFLTNAKSGADLTAKDVLFSRRADLGQIDLTCANTSIPLPYVDLVNEALEDFIAKPPTFSAFNLTAALTDDLHKRKVSQPLCDAFDLAFSARDYLCESAAVEVVKAGGHWRLHDCAYSYDIRLESGTPRVKTRGRQTRGSQQELAANPQYLNPKAYEKLKGRVFPLTLPFDLDDAEARTYLEHLGVKRHQVMETFLPGNREERLNTPAVAYAHLGMTTAEAKLITGVTESQTGPGTPDGWDPGLWNLWGFAKEKLEPKSAIPDPANSTTWVHKIKVPTQAEPNKTSNAWLDLLTGRVDVFLQQSGLTYKEMLDLVGTYFVNGRNARGKRSIRLDARPGAPRDTCETKRLQLVGIDQDAALRAMRFIRLWRKLGWRMQDLDRALTALWVNRPGQEKTNPTKALGATGASPIDEKVLTQLSHIQRLHEQLGVPIARLLPFWGYIDSALYIDHDSPGQEPFVSLYEQLFRNKEVINPPDPDFTQDPFEMAGKLSGHRAAIASALGLGAADLDLLLGDPDIFPEAEKPPETQNITESETSAETKDELSLANLSTLYRHATLARALGLSVRNYLIARKLAFDPFASTAKTLRFVEQVQTLSRSDLTLVELDYLCRHRTQESDRVAPTDAQISRELTALRTELQRIAAEHRFEDDKSAPGGPTVDLDGELTRGKLALLGWEGELIDEIVATLTDTAVWRVKFTPPSTTTAQNYAKEVAKLNVYEVSLTNLPQNLIPEELQQVITHTDGKLKASRSLDLSERSALTKAVKGHPSVESAVEALIDQQKGHLTKIWYDQGRAALCFTGVMRKSRLDMLVHSSLATTNATFKQAVKDLYKAPRTFFKRNLRSYEIGDFHAPLEKLPKKTGPGAKGTIEFPAAVRGKIVFDANKVCTTGKQGCLSFVGAMTKEELSMLLERSTDTDTDTDYRNAIKTLYERPDKAASKGEFLTKDDVTALFDKPETPAERFKYLLKDKEKKENEKEKKGLLEYLRDTLSRRAVVKSLAEALDPPVSG